MALVLNASQFLKIFNVGGVLSATNGYSVAAWANPQFASDAAFHAICTWGVSGGNNPLWLGIGTQGSNYTFNAFNNAADTGFATTSTTATQGDWFFCVASYFGTTTNLWVWHYTGGTMSQLTVGTSATATADADGTTQTFFIGCAPSLGAKWNGYIHNVVLWVNAALTKQEAQAMAFGASPRTIRPRHIYIEESLDFPGFNTGAPQMSPPRGLTDNIAQNSAGVGFSTPDVAIANPPPSGLLPFSAPSHYWQAWDQRLPIISQTARRPFPAPLQSLVATPVASTVDFRKTLSGIGSRIGSRQIQGWGM